MNTTIDSLSSQSTEGRPQPLVRVVSHYSEIAISQVEQEVKEVSISYLQQRRDQDEAEASVLISNCLNPEATTSTSTSTTSSSSSSSSSSPQNDPLLNNNSSCSSVHDSHDRSGLQIDTSCHCWRDTRDTHSVRSTPSTATTVDSAYSSGTNSTISSVASDRGRSVDGSIVENLKRQLWEVRIEGERGGKRSKSERESERFSGEEDDVETEDEQE